MNSFLFMECHSMRNIVILPQKETKHMSVLRCTEADGFCKCEVPRHKPWCKCRCTDSARASVVNPVHLGCIEPALCTLCSQLVWCSCISGCQMFQKGPLNGWNNLFIWTKFVNSVDNICSPFSEGKISSLLFLFLYVLLLPWKWLLILSCCLLHLQHGVSLREAFSAELWVWQGKQNVCWHHFRFLTAVLNC